MENIFFIKNSNLIILAELIKIVPRTLRECFSNYCVTLRVIAPQKLLDTHSVLWLPSHVLCTCLVWPVGERHATSDTNNMHKVTEQNGIKHRGPHTTSPHKPFIHCKKLFIKAVNKTKGLFSLCLTLGYRCSKHRF